MATLGQMLIADGWCTPKQVEEAIENQVIMGGRTGTNLIELGYVDEKTVATYLGKQFSLPFLYGDDIHPAREALGLVTPQQADRWEVIPYRVEGRRLQVLCVDPRNFSALDELRFSTGLQPDPVIVTEIRFWKLLRQHYGVERALRYLALEARDFLAGTFQDKRSLPPNGSGGGELMTEEDFARLYQKRDGFPVVKSKPPEANIPLISGEDLELVESAADELSPLEKRVWEAPEPAGERRLEDRPAMLQPSSITFPPPVDEEAEETLSFAEAQSRLQQASDRHQLARVLLKYARSLFARAMLFTVHREVLLGWEVAGGGLNRLAFRSLMINLAEPSVFRQVVESRAHYLGALQKTRVNIDFLRRLGKQVPLSVFAMPILVRGRVVNVFYGDNGHKQHCPAEVGQLLILAQQVSQRYAGLFDKKRTDFLRAGGPQGGE